MMLGAVGLLAQQPQAPPDAAQLPPVTFKVEINYVEVDAVVSDEQGNFVRDLSQADFEIFEDGQVQDVTVFSLVDIPIERVARPRFAEQPIEPDVSTNERAFNGRLYVLALDDLHSYRLRSYHVKEVARQFVEEHLAANDLAAVVYTSGRTDTVQEFTNNRRLLLAAIDKFSGQKARPRTMERRDAYNLSLNTRLDPGELNLSPDDPLMNAGSDGLIDISGTRGRRVEDPLDFERGFKALSALRSLKGIAEWMNGIRGRRKALLYMSEGIDYDVYDTSISQFASSIQYAARDAIGAATRANVNIYTVDPRGLTSLGDEDIEIRNFPVNEPSAGVGPDSFWDDIRLSQGSLRELAAETGGFAVLNSNDFEEGFNRIVRDNSSYYVLGYYPTNDARDGKFRDIEVRVKRPDIQVRARKGYRAPRGREPDSVLTDAADGTSVEMREALTNPLQASGLALEASAAPFKGPMPNASVAVLVQVTGAELGFAERDGMFRNRVELSFVAIDREGVIRGAGRQLLELTLKPETHALISERGFRILTRVELPPGQYQLRIGTRETERGAIGTVYRDLEVPDFSKTPLSMSGMVLTSITAGLTPTAQADAELREVLPADPTTSREFSSDDVLTLFAEVYDNEPSTPHMVDISTTVRADDGRVVFKADDVRSSTELQGVRGGYGHVAEIPLRDLPPGIYVLRTEARSRLDDDATAFREVQFRIAERG